MGLPMAANIFLILFVFLPFADFDNNPSDGKKPILQANIDEITKNLASDNMTAPIDRYIVHLFL